MKYKPKSTKMLFLFLFILGIITFLLWQNNAIGITNYEVANPKIPKAFHGYKIVHISDLHNKDFKGKLKKKVRKINPDIILITGDLIDRRNTRVDIALDFAKQMVDIAPTYFVSGNHEEWSDRYQELREGLEKVGVHLMDDSYRVLSREKEKIGLMGIADPAIELKEGEYPKEESREYFQEGLTKLSEKSNTNFHILLSHRPEQFKVYRDNNIDLVFSGHAHGGQIRIPFVGGLVAPNQGLFPKYTKGIYHEKITSMVVSRGLGNSLFPLRVLNPPEVIVVTLHNQ